MSYYTTAAYNGGTETLMYNLRRGIWHRLAPTDGERTGIRGGFEFCGRTYIVTERAIERVAADTDGIGKWYVVSAPTYDNTLDDKMVGEMWIYAELDAGSAFTVYTSIDGGAWTKHSTFTAPGLNVYRCPIRAINGTNYRYKLEGSGNIVIQEIEIRKSIQGARRYKER